MTKLFDALSTFSYYCIRRKEKWRFWRGSIFRRYERGADYREREEKDRKGIKWCHFEISFASSFFLDFSFTFVPFDSLCILGIVQEDDVEWRSRRNWNTLIRTLGTLFACLQDRNTQSIREHNTRLYLLNFNWKNYSLSDCSVKFLLRRKKWESLMGEIP